MATSGIIKKGEYFDSVTLMNVAKKLSELPGVNEAAVVMGTKENRAILESTGLLLKEFAASSDSDLLIAVKAESGEICQKTIGAVDSILKSLKNARTSSGTLNPKNLEAAIKVIPDVNLVLISVAGKYAGDEAMKALRRGLHVMLFSDNVPLETEIELKKYAIEHGLLVMGPDCGTAIINGVPLAFANVVKRGLIGIVAASGTGLQETSCLISNAGEGISQAIGTGGRDVGKEVGGLMFIEAIKALAKDANTKVILLVSKPPHESVLEKIGVTIKGIDRPIVAIFLGADTNQIKRYGMFAASTLAEAAFISVAIARGLAPDELLVKSNDQNLHLANLPKGEARQLVSSQKYIRGLFSGGTFCSEAQVLFNDLISDVYSNAPYGGVHKLENPLISKKHTLIDLGADEFTVGRPHPMIDYSLRNKRLIEEAKNETVAVVLLDIVLGYGSNPDPLAEIIPAIKQAKAIARESGRHLPIVCSVTGTDSDPQNRSIIIDGLKKTEVLVMESNAAACILAGLIAEEVNR